MANETVTVRDPSGTRWHVVDTWRERLFIDDVFLPEELVRQREVLKETSSRTVERFALASGESLVVKRYPHRAGLEGLKRLLPHGAARSEWENGRTLRDLGVPCAEPVAYGRFPGSDTEPASEVLVTVAIEDSSDLADLWREDVLDPTERRELVRAFARLIRTLHDAGVAHEDPHLKNFLAGRRGDVWEVVPIDLRRLKTGARLGPAGRDANLLLLYQTMGLVVSRADRLRFLSTYLGGDAGQRRAHASRLEDEGERQVRRYRRRRAAAALGSNSRFQVLDVAGVRWHVRKELRDEGVDLVLADPESAFEAPDEVLKEGGSAQVVVKDGWVVKRIRAKRRRQLVLDRVRRGKAVRAFQRAFLLELSGIATPRVAAAGKRVEAGVVRRSYLVCERVPDARHVDVALVEAEPETRPTVVAATGALIGALHAQRIAHRDLKAGNIVVDAEGRPWLVDLDGLSLRRVVTPPRAAHDLARLFRDLRARAATTTEEERALVVAYARAADLSDADVSPLLALIERAPRLADQARADAAD